MYVKRMAALFLSATMAISLMACGSAGSTSSATGSRAVSSAGSTAASTAGTVSTANSAAASAQTGAVSANSDPANTETTDKTLKICLGSEPSTIWGSAVGKIENESQYIVGALMDTLVTVDQNTGDVLPDLATSWEWTDSTHCKFTLRDDVTMSDGAALTAEDVVYSVGVWTSASANTDTGRYLDVATTKADDAHTVTIGFNTTAPDLLSMLSWTNFGIVSKAEVDALGGLETAANNPQLGSGKYKFKEWQKGQSITLERNDNYWNKDYKGYYKEIVFTFISDAASRALAVQSGDCQVACDMPVSQASTYISNQDVKTVLFTFGQNDHLWYNMTEGRATADQKVREAIDKALDFDALAQVATGGFGQAVLGYFDPGSKYYNETYTKEERAVDVEGARQLLKEAGYESGLQLSLIGTQDSAPLYTVIQENLRAVGIEVMISDSDTAQFVQSAFGGDYDIIAVGDLTAARYPSIFTALRKADIASGYVIGGPKVTTDEIDSAIATTIQEPDDAKAKEDIAAVEKLLKDQTIQSNLYTIIHAAITSSDLKGFTTRERGFVDVTNFY